MIEIRKSNDRGLADHGWLQSHHTFSFGSYRDPEQMGFRSLRVINEDRVAAGQGFGTHGHQDMEIVSYVLEGALEHKDSMGNGEILRPGEFQRISAGTGITHSEFNPSQSADTHFYQIWIHPEQKDLPPSYEQKRFDADQRQNQWQLVASPDGHSNSLVIHQDAKILLADLQPDESLTYDVSPRRHVWLQILRGSLTVPGVGLLETGDGIAVSDEATLQLTASSTSELMLFDLA